MRALVKIMMSGLLVWSSFAIAITDPGKTIMVDHKDKQFVVTLASTPSTGFSWLLENYDIDKVKLVKHEYIAPVKSMPGKSGVEEWTFAISPEITVGPQLTKIGLINARLWDVSNTMNKETTFTVVIY